MRIQHFYKVALGLALAAIAFYGDLFLHWGVFLYLGVSFYLAKISLPGKLLVVTGSLVSSLIIISLYFTGHWVHFFSSDFMLYTLILGFVWLSLLLNIRTDQASQIEDKVQVRVTTAEKEEALDHLKRINKDIETYKAERKLIENELLKGKRLHEAIAHNFPDGVICVLNKDFEYILADGRGLEEMGLKSVELPGQRAAIGSGAELIKAFAGERVAFETTINHSPYTVDAVPIPDANNEIKEILVVIRNITDRKRMENNLVKALEKEKELGLLKSQFVTMASHKFRTPLSTILSSVFLLENNLEADDQEKKSYYEKIKRSVHNLTGLLNDFLSLGKLEEGKVKAAFSETNIKSFFEEFLEEIVLIKKAKQEILYHYEGVSNTVMTDQLLLKSILMSLVSNAIEYSAYDAEIQLDVELTKDNLRIRVSDQGIGIPKDEQHQIFKRFFRGQNANNVEGTGLGLNIANKYIRLLKGTLEFTSQVNKGTTFIANIPVVALDILEKQT